MQLKLYLKFKIGNNMLYALQIITLTFLQGVCNIL